MRIACRNMVVESVMGKGRNRSIGKQCVDEDIVNLILSAMETHDRVASRNGILVNRLGNTILTLFNPGIEGFNYSEDLKISLMEFQSIVFVTSKLHSII